MADYTQHYDIIRDAVGIEMPNHMDLLTDENLEKIAKYFVEEAHEDPDKLFDYIKSLKPEGNSDTETAVFDAESTRDTKTKKARRSNADQRMMNKVIIDESEALQGTNYGKSAYVMSLRSAILAWLNTTPAHMDISKSTKTDANGVAVTTVGVKQCAAGAIKGVVVAVPQYAMEEVQKYTKQEHGDPNDCDVERANQENQPYVVRMMSIAEFTDSFISSEVLGSVREADEIWCPTVIKKRLPKAKESTVTVFETLDDIEKNQKENDAVVAGKNAVYMQTAYRKVSGQAASMPYIRIKHTIRQRFQAPGNYIPARIYDEIEIKDSYSAEEAERLNRLYIRRLEKQKYKGAMLLNTLRDDDTTIVTSIDEATKTKTIIGSRFFTTNAAESVMRDPIAHWYNKDANGNPVMVSPVGEHLIRREFRTTQSGKETPYIVYKEMQAEQNATGTAYVPDFSEGGMFGKIGNACRKYGVTINVADLISFFKSQDVIRDKSGKRSGGSRKQSRPIGLEAFGFKRSTSSQAIQSALNAARG